MSRFRVGRAVAQVSAIAWTAVAAAGCGGAAALPTAPLLLRPFGGEWTGSVWSERSLRPRFRWTGVQGTALYQVQVDDSCYSPATCDFPSPEIDATTTETELQPDASLAVSLSPPVGRRYFWRVRACSDAACGPWSGARYVNVGRQRQDFNGDGFGDLVVATGGFLQIGSEDVYFGGGAGTLPSTPGWTVTGDQTTAVGGQAVWAGDLDGDGFPDLAFVAARWDGAYLLRVYAGGAVPGTSPAVEIEDVDGIWLPQWISDLNGDGFDDLLFSRSSTAPTDEVLLGGRPIGAGVAREIFLPVPSGQLGNLLATGDVDHDGRADLLRTLPGALSRLISVGAGSGIADRAIALPPDVQGMTPAGYLGDPLGRGAATVFFSDGGQRSRAATLVEPTDAEAERCDADLTLPPGSPSEQSPVVALGDIDGDGQDDFAIGYPLANEVRLYFGACGFGRALDLPGPAPPDPAGPVPKQRNGDIVASPGDMDGDGFPELAVSSRWFGIDTDGGQVYLYRGGPSVGAASAVILPSASRSPEGFAASVD